MTLGATRDALIAALASMLAVAAISVIGASIGPTSGAAVSIVEPAGAPTRPATDAGVLRGHTEPTTLPGGRRSVFGGGHFLVAYYGTAGTPALGVLGDGSPAQVQRRLARAGSAFARKGHPVQLVYELIVSIADSSPGPDGDYSHDLTRAQVEPYLRAAHRNDALLLLDIQTGRSDFPTVARRWRWALEDPWVGLALDPEWRMGGAEVPGRVIGHVDAAEVNRTAAWLSTLVEHRHLPQKLFVLHQFRTGMIRHVDRVRHRPGLVMVQHVDGFGTPTAKRATFHAVARPQRFMLGFKLFYRADVHRMSAADVFRLRPRVRFVSFQ